MNTYLKYKPAWLQLIIFGSLAVGASLTLGTASILAIRSFFGTGAEDIATADLSQPQVLAALKWSQALLTLSIFLVPPLIFAYLSDRRPLNYLGWKSPTPTSFWWISFALILVALPAATWINQVNHELVLPASMKKLEESLKAAQALNEKLQKAFLNMKNLKDLLGTLLLMAVLPAIAEELFFRSVLQRLFIQITKRPWLGILLTGFLFAFFHSQFYSFITIFFLGTLLGAIYWYSGSIWLSIAVHFLNNALQVMLVYYRPEYLDKEPIIQPIWVIVSIAATIGLVMYMRKISHTHFGELYDTDDDLILPSQKTKPDQ